MDSSLNSLRKKAEKDLSKATLDSNVVLVEDSDLDFTIINKVLSPQYNVSRFSTKAEALLEQLGDLKVSLFLFDYRLPVWTVSTYVKPFVVFLRR